MGELTRVNATMPHPDGNISVTLHRNGVDGIEALISLPAKLTGEFVWKGKSVPLTGGVQQISF